MSTILDALSKAEQERRVGALPDLHFPPAFPGPARNRRNRLAAWWLLPVAGLVLAFVWWWMAGPAANRDGRLPVPAASAPMPDARPQPEAAPTSGSDVANNGADGQPVDAARSTAATEKLAEAENAARAAASETSAGSKPPLRSGIEWSTQKPAAEVRKPRQTAQLKPTASPEAPAVAAANAGAGRSGEGSADVGARSAGATIPSQAAASPAGDSRKAPLAHELPADIRGQLPKLKIGGYIYSSKPAERSVLINNKLLREGEIVAQDLRLEQLLPDGVLLNYRGHRYRVGY